MSHPFSRFGTTGPVVGMILAGCAVAAGGATGCESILGIHDVSLEGTGGTGGATTTSTVSTTTTTSSGTTTTSSGTTTTSSGTGGTGGQSNATFSFAITDASVNVPYGGLNYVNVEVIPSDGFSGPVTVTAQGAPTGFVAMPLTIPAGTTSGQLEVGAQTTLVLGTSFTLTLAATSGAITRTASVPAVVTGQPGTLDTSFNGGIVAGPTYNSWIGFQAVQELSTGAILASGLALNSLGGGVGVGARFLASGMPDVSFNGTGSLTKQFANTSAPPTGFVGLAREIDGTTLFVGSTVALVNGTYTPDNIYLFRYTNAGVLDDQPSYDDNGVDVIALGGDDIVTTGLAVPNSTDLFVAGSKAGALFVARVLDLGSSVQTSFASPNGFVVPALGGTGSSAGALAIDSQGRIVVTGWVTSAATGDDVVVLRLTAAGALDTTFGQGGFVTLPRPGTQHGSAVVVQPGDSVVVAASTDEGSAPQLLVHRLSASGTLDPGFGKAGVVLAPLGSNPNTVGNSITAWMVQMLDGRLVVGGNGTVGSVSGPVLARFATDGSPDPTFGTGGELAVYVGMYGTLGAMCLTSAGKLILAGSNSANPPGASYIARLWN